MLCFFVCLFFILGTTAQIADEPKCNLPPPNNSSNSEIELTNYQLERGIRIYRGSFNDSVTKVLAYTAEVKCNPGFILVGWPQFYCTDGEITNIPDCVCITSCIKSTEPDPSTLECIIATDSISGVSKCTIPTQGTVGFGGTANNPIPQTALQIGAIISVILNETAYPVTCGRLSSSNLVVNGQAAKYGDVPWHVGIYTKATRPYMQVCGGTLVRNNVVISAAHCFWNDVDKKLPAENFAVAAGKLYRPWNNMNDNGTATKSDIREIRIPPRYRGGATNFQDDLAVLLLTTPLRVDNRIVVLACLDFDNTLDEKQLQGGRIGTVAGWGLTSADGPASQFLNIVKLPMVDIERCINEADPSFLTSITSDKICAGYTNGSFNGPGEIYNTAILLAQRLFLGTTVCRGDSGGGLVIPENDEEGDKYYLRGVVSTAPKSDHLCNVYAVATFTHLAKHRHFINAAISGAPEKTPLGSPSIGMKQPAVPQYIDPFLNDDIITGDTESDIRPNNDFNILPITSSPNDKVEQLTDLYKKKVFCKYDLVTFMRKCYFSTKDLDDDINPDETKCKKKVGPILDDCE